LAPSNYQLTRRHEDEFERHLTRVRIFGVVILRRKGCDLRREFVALKIDVALHLYVDQGEVVGVADRVFAILFGT
jgi:hypothetical protein